MVSRYAIPIGIPQVDGWSKGPSGFGVSQDRPRERIKSIIEEEFEA